MPELPEVETIKRQLDTMITGLTIMKIEIRSSKSFIGDKREIIGKRIEEVKRFGKMIQIKVYGKKDLVIHLKMTGQLIFQNKQETICLRRQAANKQPVKATRVIFTFTDNSHLYFNDNRKFGWIRVVSDEELIAKNNRLGIEPYTKNFNVDRFSQVLLDSKKAIKLLLMEQEKISGLGNIYTNEALFLSKLDPTRKGNSLSVTEIKNLYSSILEVLEAGIMHQGSSGKDKGYVTVTGEMGKHQNYFWVYQREGEKCKRCGSLIKRMMVGQRGTWYCGRCQI